MTLGVDPNVTIKNNPKANKGNLSRVGRLFQLLIRYFFFTLGSTSRVTSSLVFRYFGVNLQSHFFVIFSLLFRLLEGGSSGPAQKAVGRKGCLAPSKNFRSGKTDPVQFKGRFQQGLFTYKNGRFASSILLLGIGFLEASQKANLSFESPSPKPHLNWTGQVLHSHQFAIPEASRLEERVCACKTCGTFAPHNSKRKGL